MNRGTIEYGEVDQPPDPRLNTDLSAGMRYVYSSL